LGGKVIATAGSEAKREVCKRLGGADHVVDYNNKDWPKEVMRLTGGKGVGKLESQCPRRETHD
jgi:NADPH:quinone reductase-like Zn-dependent oxidoreductase